MAGHLDPSIAQVVPSAYRNPRSLPDSGVLVVGTTAATR
jgi:cation diffusion facilitator CzcD-associated flavoprotein CzcO